MKPATLIRRFKIEYEWLHEHLRAYAQNINYHILQKLN